jgi:hypothetical protein
MVTGVRDVQKAKKVENRDVEQLKKLRKRRIRRLTIKMKMIGR